MYTLDLRNETNNGPLVATKITDVPEAKLLNGMTTLPNGIVFMSDCVGGNIWWVNISSSEYGSAVNHHDPLLQPGAMLPIGVNGIRTHDRDLYFANSGMGLFGRIRLDDRGDVVGKAERLVDVPGGVRAFDDFAVNGEGTVWVATHDDAVTVIAEGGDVDY